MLATFEAISPVVGFTFCPARYGNHFPNCCPNNSNPFKPVTLSQGKTPTSIIKKVASIIHKITFLLLVIVILLICSVNSFWLIAFEL